MSTNITTKAHNIVTMTTAKKVCWNFFHAHRKQREVMMPFFWGPPGVGKTSMVYQFVDEINDWVDRRRESLVRDGGLTSEEAALKEKKWVGVSYRLSQCDPTDLKGVPTYRIVNGKEMTGFAPPFWFPIKGIPESAEGLNVVCFLDEVAQAPGSLQNLAANIIDLVIGDYRIDIDRIFFVGASNQPEDGAATFEMPSNVKGRICHFYVRTKFEEWMDWSMTNGLNALVVGYLNDHVNVFNHRPSEDVDAYPTPRAWHKVSNLIQTMGEEKFFDDEEMTASIASIAGYVGPGIASDFYSVAKMTAQKYSIRLIMNGDKVPAPTAPDICYALALQAATLINGMVDEVIDQKQYRTGTDTASKKLVTYLGPENVKRINNVYTWFSESGVDLSYMTLLNKYQNDNSRSILRTAMFIEKEFDEAKSAYMKIHGVIAAGTIGTS